MAVLGLGLGSQAVPWSASPECQAARPEKRTCALPSCEVLRTARLEFSFFDWLLGVTQERKEDALGIATERTRGRGRAQEREGG